MNIKAIIALAFLSSAGCAHRYYYVPEVDGAGATHEHKGGVVYEIPPTGPQELILKVKSLGPQKIKDQEMLAIRFSFERPADKAAPRSREYIKPEEFALIIGDMSPIKPAYLHSKARQKEIIDLTNQASEVVEVLFPLPKDSRKAKDLEDFKIHWRVHYGKDKTEAQTVTFHRRDAAPRQAAEYDSYDPNYPYAIAPMGAPGWTPAQDPYWWGMDPYGPWW